MPLTLSDPDAGHEFLTDDAVEVEGAPRRLRSYISIKTTEESGTLPAWFRPVLAEVRRLLALPAGWDSYQARRIDPKCIGALLELLVRTIPSDLPPPRLDATSKGGVVALWQKGTTEIELEIPAPDRYRLLHVHGGREEECEVLATDLRPLMRAIDDLAHTA